MNTNKMIDDLLIEGCDNRYRGVIYKDTRSHTKVTKEPFAKFVVQRWGRCCTGDVVELLE